MKYFLVLLIVLTLTACQNNNSMKNDYTINNYADVYKNLETVSNKIIYIPSKELEERFFKLVINVKDNYQKFSKEELSKLYDLMNIDYDFKYILNKYNNQKFKNDLKIIKQYITG